MPPSTFKQVRASALEAKAIRQIHRDEVWCSVIGLGVSSIVLLALLYPEGLG